LGREDKGREIGREILKMGVNARTLGYIRAEMQRNKLRGRTGRRA